ncbi:MAG: 4Fe-4S dicluster domain-containing protein, partial [Phycisphaerae bacterium]|nr:4Fe-4S dicluster domain-containing protein [Phycisphaerae bacterium]
ASAGTPALDAPGPKAIVIKAVCAEPFRARGKVVLENNLELFLQGLSYLERISGEFAPTYLILTAAQHPLAQKIKKEVAGLAWVRPIFVPLVYPVGNNQYLWRCLRRNESNLQRGDSIWFLDCQAVTDIARCLGQGLVPFRRIVSLGGPGYERGGHVLAPIGTPLSRLCSELENFEGLRVLRGGMLAGEEVDPAKASVGHLDDGFTFLAEGTEREFLSFVRAGFDRPSYTAAYGSWLRPKKAVPTSTSLRGERRACIACGYCEDVCPVDIMPHLIWRFLEKDLLEEAQAAGAQICVECGLCSYVCPSKIELARTISKGIEQIHEELVADIVDSETQEVKA